MQASCGQLTGPQVYTPEDEIALVARDGIALCSCGGRQHGPGNSQPEAGRGNVLFKLHRCRRQACARSTVCWMRRLNARSTNIFNIQRKLGVAHAHTLVGLRPACAHSSLLHAF